MRVKVSGGGARVCRGGNERSSGQFVYKGDWDASTNLFPSGVIKKGFAYSASDASTTLLMPDGGIIPVGTMIVAKIDSPATSTDWLYFLTVI